MIELKVGIRKPMMRAYKTAKPSGTGSLLIPRSSVKRKL